jgi:hypothetical protein
MKQHPAYYYTPEQRRSKKDWKVLYSVFVLVKGECYSSFYLGGVGGFGLDQFILPTTNLQLGV